jgi:hypothetical protein
VAGVHQMHVRCSVPGRSSLRPSQQARKIQAPPLVRRCCARGRAHSGGPGGFFICEKYRGIQVVGDRPRREDPKGRFAQTLCACQGRARCPQRAASDRRCPKPAGLRHLSRRAGDSAPSHCGWLRLGQYPAWERLTGLGFLNPAKKGEVDNSCYSSVLLREPSPVSSRRDSEEQKALNDLLAYPLSATSLGVQANPRELSPAQGSFPYCCGMRCPYSFRLCFTVPY